jgi:hypothetical protein
MMYLLILVGLLHHPTCVESANQHEAWTIPDIGDRVRLCSVVATRAELRGLPVEVIVELMWSESTWSNVINEDSGCSGPLQASPRWWCPDRKRRGCDLVAAGFRAFEAYTAKHPDLEDALCHYKSGNVCTPAARKGAREVLRWVDGLGGSA